jgi:prepilin-type N-terminal cleavage/methylation domain-containing protein
MKTRLLHRLRRVLHAEDGFGLLELMISLVILSIAIAALLAVFGAGAFALARTGQQGTASALVDNVVEYYHRAPWSNVHLVKVAVTPTPTTSATNLGETAAASDADYTGQCGATGCPKSYISTVSALNVDSDNGELSTCDAPSGTPGSPTFAAQAPPTWCAAIYDVTGADSNLYRVYTYMRYGCLTTVAVGTTCTSAETDKKTKIVTVIVRLVAPDGTLKVPDVGGVPQARGILAQETFVLNYNSYVSQ